MTITGARRRRANEDCSILDPHRINRERLSSWTLPHSARCAIESRTVPRALNRPIGQHVAKRNGELLMRAGIGYCSDPSGMTNETNCLTRKLYDAEGSVFGDFFDLCDWFETGLFQAQSAVVVDYPDKFT